MLCCVVFVLFVLHKVFVKRELYVEHLWFEQTTQQKCSFKSHRVQTPE